MKKRWISVLIVSVMLVLNAVSTFAASNVSVYLPEQQIWTAGLTDQRSGTYYSVFVNLDSVYPTGNQTDLFRKAQVRIRNSSGTVIMEKPYETLTEGAGRKTITILDGYLPSTVFFQFRGNTTSAAYAIVDYDAR